MHEINLSDHAKERMAKYSIPFELLVNSLERPSSVLESRRGRRIYQKRLNGHLLRVILEEDKGIKRIITVYKARRERYEI